MVSKVQIDSVPVADASVVTPKRWSLQSLIHPHTILFAAVTVLLLYSIRQVHYLLFHSIAEIFSIVIASAVFMVSWNSREWSENPSLVYLGIAYLFIGILDLFHTLSYKGMGIFTDYDFYANQVWIAARYVESLTLLCFFAFVGSRRRIPYGAVFLGYALLTTAILAAIFLWRIFPVCFVAGEGLTPFKKISEYIICLFLTGALAAAHRNRDAMGGGVYPLLAGSILLTIGSELAFTFYISNYGFSNLVGHLLKIGSFYLVYKAIIETGLKNPFDLIFRKLKESEERYRSLFNMALVGIFRTSMDGEKVLAANPAAAAIFGYESVQEFIDRLVPQACWADTDQRDRIMSRIENGESIDYFEAVLLDRTGDRKHVAVSVAPYPRAGYVEGAILDITETVENKRRMADAAEQAALQRGKIEMAGSVLHDIGNAVTGLGTRISRLIGEGDWVEIEELGNLQEMVRRKGPALAGALGPGKEEALAAFIRELRLSLMDRNRQLQDDGAAMSRTVSHINEILHLQRHYAVEKGGVRRSLDIIDLMEDALAMTWAGLQKRSIRLERRFRRPLPMVSGDRTRLIQVIINLIKNAGEAFDGCDREGTRQLIIDIGAVRDDTIRIALEDNAAGFDPEEGERLFEQGFSTKNRSSGMGLSQCREIIVSHGGRLEMVSAGPGKGAAAIIELPGKKEMTP
jgi:PAS domain S-box-containing protein